jgi:predicted nucleic acid-binding protein
MSAADFFDSNTLLYLISPDAGKASRAEQLLRSRGTVSVQVLNEFVNVATRKHALGWAEIEEALLPVQLACRVEPLTVETHERATAIAERYGYRIYDSCILAAALLAGCTTLWSEDLHHGQVIEGRLTIRNPFA